MKFNHVEIYDTFAEAWTLEVVRVLITAMNSELAMGAAQQFAGAGGSSMIGSKVNAGIERIAAPSETPDGRVGVYVSLAMTPENREPMLKELELRVALASLVPTVAVYDASVDAGPTVAANIHDQFNMSKERWTGRDGERKLGERTLCVVPTTTGEFVYEKTYQISPNGTDGHFVCFAENAASAVAAISLAKDALAAVDGVAPMGYGLEQVFREFDYIPSLRNEIADTKIPEGVNSVLNLLMFGARPDLMQKAMAVALAAACQAPGVMALTAMNFGGQFGKHQYHLRPLLGEKVLA
jgi:formylmethanofuran--tetrahydromethanopterin N-formyltransferase